MSTFAVQSDEHVTPPCLSDTSDFPEAFSVSPQHSGVITDSDCAATSKLYFHSKSPAPPPTPDLKLSVTHAHSRSSPHHQAQTHSAQRSKSSQPRQPRRNRRRHRHKTSTSASALLTAARPTQSQTSAPTTGLSSTTTSSVFGFLSRGKISNDKSGHFSRAVRSVFILGCMAVCIILFYRQMHLASISSTQRKVIGATHSLLSADSENVQVAQPQDDDVSAEIVARRRVPRGSGSTLLSQFSKPLTAAPTKPSPIDIQLLHSDSSSLESLPISPSYANSDSSTLSPPAASSLGGIYSSNFNQITTTSRRLQSFVVQQAIATLYTPARRFRLHVLLHTSGNLGYSLEYCSPPGPDCEDWEAILLPAFVKLKVNDKLALFNVAEESSTLHLREYSGVSVWTYNRTARMDRYHLPSEYEVMSRKYVGVQISCHVKESCSTTMDWTLDFRLFDDSLAIRALVYFKPAAFPHFLPAESDNINSLDLSDRYVPVALHMSVRTHTRKLVQWCFGSVDDSVLNGTACESVHDGERQTPFTVRIRYPFEEIKRSKKNGINVFTIAQAGGWNYAQSSVHFLSPFEQINLRFEDNNAGGDDNIKRRAKAAGKGITAGASRNAIPEMSMDAVVHGEAALMPKIGLDNLDAELSYELGGANGDPQHAVVASSTSWHVILFGMNEADMYAANVVVPLLCPPPSETLSSIYNDVGWLGRASGKALSIPAQSSLKDAKGLVTFARAHRFQFVQLAEGWYVDDDKFAILGSGTKSAHTKISMDVNELVLAAKAQGIGVTISFTAQQLKSVSLSDVLKSLRNLGVNGLKLIDVDVSSPRAVRVFHRQMVTIGKANIFLNVHHFYRPRGYSRTFPHLLTQEGVRSEQHRPDAAQHVALIFNRAMIGSSDYAPTYAEASASHDGDVSSCTRAHQLALPFALFGVIHNLFGDVDPPAIQEVYTKYPELSQVWDSMPAAWDDSVMLAGELPEYAVIARYTHDGHRWYLAMLAGINEVNFRVSLASLFNSARASYFPANTFGFLFSLYRDADNWPYIRPHQTLVTRTAPCWISMRKVLAAINGTKLTAEDAEQDHGRVTRDGQPLEQCVFELQKYPVVLAKSGGALLKIDPILL